ncbi:hypothetical protein [Lyngbya sp. CCY1209]|uniref:hypothetical protein n=1 Tax=Lyngbya sp. CCY1209 TaxID=2886103 RepID=UPI002D204C89|nr:hypothetical protein [Lyngbya sp. CCY1209]MEB3886150.1 hypothetical protein [Lyngbya sp. CCY1209]
MTTEDFDRLNLYAALRKVPVATIIKEWIAQIPLGETEAPQATELDYRARGGHGERFEYLRAYRDKQRQKCA